MHIRKIPLLCSLMLCIFATVTDARILFSSRRDGVNGIYVMDDDGSNQTLIRTEGHHMFPASDCFSPDGQWIAFQGELRGIYLMHPNGTNVQRLPIPKGHGIDKVSFSPDSTSLVFSMWTKIDNKIRRSINIMDIATEAIKEIAEVNGVNCDWSPDGELITFTEPGVVGKHNNGTLWIIDADGGIPRKLPRPVRGRYRGARWSPDGKQIVYLYDDYAWERHPDVGPGTFLVYKGHQYLICNRNGKNVKRLRIPKNWWGTSIDWMDDGESVVFCTRVNVPLDRPVQPDEVPTANIYKYHIWTQTTTRLTDHPGLDQSVNWISDDVLPVAPQDKKKVTWGTLKK